MQIVYDSGIDYKIFEYLVNLPALGQHLVEIKGVESDGDYDTSTYTFKVISTDSESILTDDTYTKVNTYIIGNTVYAKITDYDQNLNEDISETINAVIQDSNTGDSEDIVLNEISPDSGVFYFSGIISALGAGVPNNNILEVQNNDIIQIVYADPNDAADTSSDTAVMILSTASTVEFTDSTQTSVFTYSIGDSVYVKVNDLDQNLDLSNYEYVNALVFDTVTGDTEIVSLKETGIDTGVFFSTNGLPIVSYSGVPYDGELNTAPSNTIYVRYTDPDDNTDVSTDTATINPTYDGSIYLDNTIYYPADTIIITVVDKDLNLSSSSTESVQVTIISALGDTELVLLTESGTDSDTFTGSISVEESFTYTDYDNVLTASDGDTITAIYNDESDSSGNYVIRTATAIFQGRPVLTIDKTDTPDPVSIGETLSLIHI